MHATIIIRAELSGSDTCTAVGVTAHGQAPVLALCRKLIDTGVSPNRPMLVFRGDTLALRIRSIGEAASLQINGHGTGFNAPRGGGTASPMRRNWREAT